MGIVVSHGCWDGPCRSFHFWRKAVARAIDVDLSKMRGFGGRRSWFWLRFKGEPLEKLLNINGDQFEIESAHCILIANRLEEIVPRLERIAPRVGHWAEQTLTFAAGLRRAAAKNERISSW